MKKKFFTSLSFLLLVNLLVKPFWIFGIDRAVQNAVGAEAYGSYFALLNFSVLFSIFLDLGLTNFTNRHISQHQQLVNKSLSHSFLLRIVLGLGYGLLVLGIGFYLRYNGWQMKLLGWLVVNQFLLSFILYLRATLAGLQLFRTDAIVSVLDRSFMIVLCSVLLWGSWLPHFRIEWFVWAQTVSYVLTFGVALTLVLYHAGSIKLHLDWAYVRMFLKQSAPYALLTLLMSVYYRVDSVMLERLLPNGQEEAGIYAQGFRILDAFGMFALLFSTLLMPMFSRMLSKKEHISDLLRFSFLLLLAPVSAFVLLTAFHSDFLMDILYTHHVERASMIFRVLIFCLIGVSSSYILGTLLTANGSLRLLNITSAAGVVVNILLNAWLIPQWQGVGAAWASLLTQMLVVVVQFIAVQKMFRRAFSFLLLAKIFCYLLVLAVLNYFAHLLPLQEFSEILVIAFVSLLLIWMFGFIKPKVALDLWRGVGK